MDPERFARVKNLFLAAREKSVAERESFLTRECGEDLDLRREVEELLAQETRSPMKPGGLDEFVAEAVDEVDAASETPKTIGPYEIQSILGRGGMGMVYRARQRTPIDREVALKLIPFGLDSASIVARFEAERQTLARMDHPHIARVLDAGATEDHSPYFVMELVDGVAITEYCRRNPLTRDGCLELFVAVCRAVQHAHQKGIIHRDLKPSNVLVTETDGMPTPKVIDFGIAKVIDEPGGSPTRTLTGEVLGTLDYMSPEQAEGSSRAIDTRSDVYALGVILFELLAGALPQDLAGLSPLEAMRAITEDVPRRLRGIAGCEEIDIDLETIVAKALEKEPERRYASAAALADDLDRLLASKPIEARAPSATYQLRKLVQRHRWPFAFAATSFVLLCAFAITTMIQLQDQRRQRTRAEAEARRATQISTFLQDMLAAARPGQLGREAKIRDLVDRAAESIDEDLADQPDMLATAHSTIAKTYLTLAIYPPARRHYERALELSRDLFGDRHADVAENLFGLGDVLYRIGKLEEAEPLIRESIAIRRTLPDDGLLERSLSLLGRTIGPQGRVEEAEQLYREARDLYAVRHGRNDLNYATLSNTLALNLMNQGRLKEAQQGFREVLALQEGLLAGDHPSIAKTLGYLGKIERELGALEEGERLLRNSIAMCKRIYGEPSLTYAQPMQDLSLLLVEQSRLDEAEAVARESLSILQEQLPPHSVRIGVGHRVLARIAFERFDYETAERSCQRAIEVFGTPNAERPINLAEARYLLARVRTKQGRWAEADSALSKSLAGFEASLGAEHPSAAQAVALRGEIQAHQGHRTAAVADLRKALDRLSGVFPASRDELLHIRAVLGACLIELERYGEAEPVLLAGVESARSADARSAPSMRELLQVLTDLYVAWQRTDEAERWSTELASLDD